MAQRIFAENGSEGICVSRSEVADVNRPFAPVEVDGDVWGMRNQLNMKETDTFYQNNLKALIDLYALGRTLESDTTDFLTDTASLLDSTNQGVFLKAIDDFAVATSGIASKIILAGFFAGTTNANRLLEFYGTATVANIGTTTFGSNGAILNGTTQAINTATAVSGLGSDIGGLGVWFYSKTDATSSLIGAKDATAGEYEIKYDTTANTLSGIFGGVAEFASQASVTAFPAKEYVHLERRSTTDMELYRQGVSVATNTTSVVATSPADVIYVGARNNDGTADSFANGVCGMYVLTNGTMSDANVLTLSTAVNNLMANMLRR